MNKTDLVRETATESGVQAATVKKVVEAMDDVIVRGLKADKEVALGGLGKLKVGFREARKARNPQTGEVVEVAARNTIKFQRSKAGAISSI